MPHGAPNAYIGTSGYQYDHWRGPFYPDDMPKKQWFEHYCRHFDCVEINNTFYHLPETTTFDAWHKQAPRGFCYALKFSRYGSHLKCLKDPKSTIGKFMEQAEHLKAHLGPILVQLKPNWGCNLERLRAFLQATPSDQRWAFEFRDPSWLCDDAFDVLRNHNAALCMHDMFDDHPREITADWTYLRFHGHHYAGSYSMDFLNDLADGIATYLEDGLDVYAFFNNDAEGHAVRNAQTLQQQLYNTT